MKGSFEDTPHEGPFDQLRASSADGEHHLFFLKVENPGFGGRIIFRIWPTPTPRFADDFAEAAFVPEGRGVYRLDIIDNHGLEWAKRKGLSEAILADAQRRLGGTIVSSRTAVEGTAERRSSYATRMWDRLCRARLARYDPAGDRYVYTPAG